MDTRQRILESGERYFLAQGFKSAPLRSIVKDAGYTLGAFYGYFKTKEELFYALTEETAESFRSLIASIASKMDELPAGERLYKMIDCYTERLPEIAEFVCSHRTGLRLLLTCSEGTRYGHFMDTFLEGNLERIASASEEAEVRGLSQDTLRLLLQGYFDILSRIILEDRTPESMCTAMRDVALVFRNGILSIMEDK